MKLTINLDADLPNDLEPVLNLLGVLNDALNSKQEQTVLPIKPFRVFPETPVPAAEASPRPSVPSLGPCRPIPFLELVEFLLPPAQRTITVTVLLIELPDGNFAYVPPESPDPGKIVVTGFSSGLISVLQSLITQGRRVTVWRSRRNLAEIRDMDDCMRFIGTLSSDHKV